MCSGVGKSGSPAPKPITSTPAAFSALALASTARVADGAMAPIRWRCVDAVVGRSRAAAAVTASIMSHGRRSRARPHGRGTRRRSLRVHWLGLGRRPCRGAPALRCTGVDAPGVEGRSSIGRAPVSKTGCCRFKSCRPCRSPARRHSPAVRPVTTQAGTGRARVTDRDRRATPDDAGGRRSVATDTRDAAPAPPGRRSRRPRPGDLPVESGAVLPRDRRRAAQGHLPDPPASC